MKLSDVSVKTRLGALIGFLALLSLAVGVIGQYGLGRTGEGLRVVYQEQMTPVHMLGRIESAVLRARIQVLRAIDNPKPEFVEKQASSAEKFIGELDEQWAAYLKAGNQAGEKSWNDAFQIAKDRYINEGIRPAFVALRAGKLEEARRIQRERIQELVQPARDNVQALIKLRFSEADREFRAAQQRHAMLEWLVWAAIAFGVVLGIGFGVLIARAIVYPLDAAVRVAEAVQAGDLTQQVPVSGRDELGRLLTALKTMNDRLAHIVGDVRESSDAVGSAAQQISSGNNDLSQRTQEQASALEETASSMEEMTSTVKQNADNARQANQLAAGARDQAEKGGQVVSKAVSAMNEINAASKRIADIISVIDEIAFQTNLLALNAAVEAARAGEQGRGFAVVASEVRNLAQRSAGAAKEIKELINDSVDKVKTGSELVDASGKTLTEIVESVKKVTDIVAEIAAASQEQSAGIEQVNKAVMQMDEVTQQNAALVEEAAAASRSMEEQAAKMVELMGFFRTGRESAAAPTASPQVSPRDVAPMRARNVPRRDPAAPVAMH